MSRSMGGRIGVPRSRPLRALSFLVIAIATVLAAAPAVLAAIPKVDIWVEEQCVVGPWPEGTKVTFTLRDKSGALKDQEVGTATEEGLAFACFDAAIRGGDRITVKVGSQSRVVGVLKLTLGAVDRVRDVVAGKAAAGRQVRLIVHRCGLHQGFNPDGCRDALSTTRNVGRGGAYSFDVTASLDLRGRDLVEVVLRTDSGDRVRRLAVVPVFFVSGLYTPGIGGQFRNDPVAEFELRDGPGGAVLASAALPSTDPNSQFRDGTDPVPVEPGHQIVGDFASDARMVVPEMITSASSATGVVQAVCFPRQSFLLNVFAAGGGEVRGKADATGAISVDVDDEGLAMPPGADLRLRCLSKRGDSITHSMTLP